MSLWTMCSLATDPPPQHRDAHRPPIQNAWTFHGAEPQVPGHSRPCDRGSARPGLGTTQPPPAELFPACTWGSPGSHVSFERHQPSRAYLLLGTGRDSTWRGNLPFYWSVADTWIPPTSCTAGSKPWGEPCYPPGGPGVQVQGGCAGREPPPHRMGDGAPPFSHPRSLCPCKWDSGSTGPLGTGWPGGDQSCSSRRAAPAVRRRVVCNPDVFRDCYKCFR